MRLVVPMVVIVAAVGFGLALAAAPDEEVASGTVSVTNSKDVVQRHDAALSSQGSLERELNLKPETHDARGVFPLRRGKSLQLATAETTDGHWCLIDVEEPSGAAGSSCYKGAPFAHSKVVFSMNMDGGPETFAELYLLGVALPGVRAVMLERTDGTTVETDPNADGAFLFESTAAELESRIYPTALHVYGPSGKLIETVDIPAVG
jgi:hypothetical protein